MDVDVIAAALDVDPARVVAKASATEDYAQELWRQARDGERDRADLPVLIASALTIAASLWLLVEPRRALLLFAVAAEQHAELASPYGAVLRICAAPRVPRWASARVQQGWTGPPFAGDPQDDDLLASEGLGVEAQPATGLLSLVWPLAAGLPEGDLASRMSDVPLLDAVPAAWVTGRLRIPFGHYRGVAEEIDRLRAEGRGSRFVAPAESREALPATAAFVARAAESIEAARSNRSQWRTLRSGLLPAEPEAVAACVLVEMTARDVRGASAAALLGVEESDRIGPAGALLGIAGNLLDTAGDGEPAR